MDDEQPADLSDVIRDVEVDITDPASRFELVAEAAETLAADPAGRLRR